MIKLLLGLLLVAQAGTRWHLVGQNDSRTTALDTHTIQRQGQRVTFWTRTNYSTPDQDGTTRLIAQSRMDCSARTVTHLSWSAQRADGAHLDSGNFPNPVAEPIAPNTTAEAIHEYLCLSSR